MLRTRFYRCALVFEVFVSDLVGVLDFCNFFPLQYLALVSVGFLKFGTSLISFTFLDELNDLTIRFFGELTALKHCVCTTSQYLEALGLYVSVRYSSLYRLNWYCIILLNLVGVDFRLDNLLFFNWR